MIFTNHVFWSMSLRNQFANSSIACFIHYPEALVYMYIYFCIPLHIPARMHIKKAHIKPTKLKGSISTFYPDSLQKNKFIKHRNYTGFELEESNIQL